MACSAISKSDGIAFGTVNLSAWRYSPAASGGVEVRHSDTSAAGPGLTAERYLSADRGLEESGPS